MASETSNSPNLEITILIFLKKLLLFSLRVARNPSWTKTTPWTTKNAQTKSVSNFTHVLEWLWLAADGRRHTLYSRELIFLRVANGLTVFSMTHLTIECKSLIYIKARGGTPARARRSRQKGTHATKRELLISQSVQSTISLPSRNN